MIITYHGMQCFRVQFGSTTLVFDPVSKESKLKSGKFGADIALSSLNHPDMNGFENATHGNKEPFVVDSPGEYEIKEITIKGFPAKSEYGGRRPDAVQRLSRSEDKALSGGKKSINTIFTVALEGMTICFLGAMQNGDINKETSEAFEENIDILFVPIGGDGTLNPQEAHKMVSSISPKIVIPMHYTETGEKGALNSFLKESSSTTKPINKLTIKKKDIEDKSTEVVVFSVS